MEPTNGSVCEQLIQKFANLQLAARKYPKHPSFKGLSGVLFEVADEIGEVVLDQFQDWYSKERPGSSTQMKSRRSRSEEPPEGLRRKQQRGADGEMRGGSLSSLDEHV